MKEFIKNNPTLAFGLGLPMLLVMVFSIAAGLPSLTAPAPKYDVIFATDYSGSQVGVQMNVVQGKLKLAFAGECSYCTPPVIYRYNSATGTIKRININLPPEAIHQNPQGLPNPKNKDRILPIAIPELDGVTLNDSNPAPDGYEFSTYDSYSHGGLFPELFFSRSYYNEGPVLRHGTYNLRIPLQKGYYNSTNVRFIGWVAQ